MNIDKIIIHTDGAARGNPGPAAIGATIKDEYGNPVAEISRRVGVTTNNQAEYLAIIAALERAVSLGAKNIEVRADSELMVKQLKGQYRVRNASLLPLYQRVKQLSGSLASFKITHVPRSRNTEADTLANRAFK